VYCNHRARSAVCCRRRVWRCWRCWHRTQSFPLAKHCFKIPGQFHCAGEGSAMQCS